MQLNDIEKTSLDEVMNIEGQIYLITNKINGKKYVGQTRSHYKSARCGYTPAGYMFRWKMHVFEALNDRSQENSKLNRAIRKYGENMFTVELIATCYIDDLNFYETFYISQYGTFSTLHYNSTPGGHSGTVSDKQKQDIANTLHKFYEDNKLKRFAGKKIEKIIIKKSCRKDNSKEVATVYAYIGGNKYITADFGGVASFESSLKRAISFSTKFIEHKNISLCSKHFPNDDIKNYM